MDVATPVIQEFFDPVRCEVAAPWTLITSLLNTLSRACLPPTMAHGPDPIRWTGQLSRSAIESGRLMSPFMIAES